MMHARLLCILLFCLLPMPLNAAEVRVLSAASLKGVIAEIAAAFEQQHPQHEVIISTAASGTLARQIAAGAPADLFLSANPDWMTYLVDAGKVNSGQPRDWASNSLVVVGRGAPLTSFDDLLNVRRIAIGSPRSAPVGRYAREMLQRAGLYERLDTERKLVLAKDVWQALLYAEQGAVDAAIVYASDSRLCEKSAVMLVPEQELQPRIRYPVALTIRGMENAAARAFGDALQSREAARILKKYGFQPLFASEVD